VHEHTRLTVLASFDAAAGHGGTIGSFPPPRRIAWPTPRREAGFDGRSSMPDDQLDAVPTEQARLVSSSLTRSREKT
jgi:hypothetical protein